jgi:hypothetical protein
MPHVKVQDKTVYVPDYIAGSQLRNLPVVRDQVRPEDTLFLVEGQDFEIVEPDQQYQVREGQEIDWASRSESG